MAYHSKDRGLKTDCTIILLPASNMNILAIFNQDFSISLNPLLYS